MSVKSRRAAVDFIAIINILNHYPVCNQNRASQAWIDISAANKALYC